MIQQNGKVLLNLESTVGELVELVEGHYAVDRVIADYGITMVNQPLQNPTQLEGLRGTKWGEAYPVGYQPPYDIYIWTRPAIGTENVADGTWFNVGKMAIPGPQGEPGVGERGETGQSTRWYIGETPLEVENPKPGDIFMVNYGNDDPNTGTLYIYSEAGRWGEPVVNIRGPKGNTGQIGPIGYRGLQGEKGDKGDRGDTAPVVTLIGITDDPSQIAETTPSAELVGKAWVLTQEDIATIWTVMETSPTVFEWQEVGVLSGFTAITVNGEFQTTFNADTKLDKVSSNVSGLFQAYCIDTSGQQTMIPVNPRATDWTIARRYDGGRLRVATPIAEDDATTKKYVDDGFVPKLQIAEGAGTFAYVAEANGKTSKIQIQYGAPLEYTIPGRGAGGRVVVGTPTGDNHATTKKYVDDAVANRSPKLYRHTIYASCYGNDYDGNSHTITMNFEILSTQSTDVSGGYVPVDRFVNLLAGPTATVAHVVANGHCDNEIIGHVSFTKADSTITVYNEWDELITAFQEENGVCSDIVQAIG